MQRRNFLQIKNWFYKHHRFNPIANITPFQSIYSFAATNPIEFEEISPILQENSVFRLLSLLRSCSDSSDLLKGKQIHAQIVVNGADECSLLTRVLGMYVLCRSFSDARNLFERIEKDSPLPWNWLIRGFTAMGWFESALLFYFKMVFAGVVPDKYTFPYVVKSCYGMNAISVGRLVHETICRMGLETDLFVGSALIKMYAEHGSVAEARKVFDEMPVRDCVLWNVMIDGYARIGDSGNVVQLFDGMQRSGTRPNYVSFACLLSVCALEGMLDCGTQLHALATKYGVDLEASVANTLLAMYSKCRCLYEACMLFDLMSEPDMVTWNSIISGCAQNGMREEALDFFYLMQGSGFKPDSITLASILPAFSNSTGLWQGKEIHSFILRNGITMDAYLKSALVDIYFKCKQVHMARKVYDSSSIIDVVICSAMISGYVLNGMSYDALEIFRQLLKARLKPNAVTVASVLPACACLTALRIGEELHCYALKNALVGRCYVESALTDMYAKCGRVGVACQIFLRMSNKDSVAWNSMIASFTQNGNPEEAISLFRQMGVERMRYDCVTISSALSACGSLPAMHYGKEIHGFMIRGPLRSDVFAESALIDMYAKCGDLISACHVFDSMHEKNEVSWNSLISAYGAHGLVKDSLNLFQQMENAGCQPDHITCLSLLSACGHAGQVEEGFKIFQCMKEDYGIIARMEHYACMVDLYGRAGRLDEALNLVESMPFKADAGIWGALLGACRVHKNAKIAELASFHLFELDPENSGYYILMSNVHAVVGRWDGVQKVRKLMKERRVQKIPGCSWISIKNTTNMFISGDKTHPDSAQIYFLMKSLLMELEEEGYIPQPEIVYPVGLEDEDST